VVMVEHKDAVERVEEILGVSGIDAVFVGPYDLSASYGIPGQFEHRLMHQALARILGAAKTAGIAPGIHVVHPPISQVRDRVAAETRILDRLGRESGLAILSEERGVVEGRTPGTLRWIVDPLDGTVNYARGIGFAAVSIALWDGDAPVLGVVHDFGRKETFSG